MNWIKCIASSFADPEDIRRYKLKKAQGLSDREAFKYGDNGIGCWGDDTTERRPMVALPPEDWKQFGKAARGKKVQVVINGAWIIAELRDTMPARKNIKNGCGIDLNPEACYRLGLKPPIRTQAKWRWSDGDNSQDDSESSKSEPFPVAPTGQNALLSILGTIFGKLFGQRTDQPKKGPDHPSR